MKKALTVLFLCLLLLLQQNVFAQCDAGTIKAKRDTICNGTPVILSDSSSVGFIQWQSADSTGIFKNIFGATNLNYSEFPSRDTFYRVYVTNGTCSDTSLPKKINVLPSPVADFSYALKNNSLQFTFNSSQSLEATKFFWDFGDGDTSSLPNPIHIYSGDTSPYHVCLSVLNNSNCSYTLCREISMWGITFCKANFEINKDTTDSHFWSIVNTSPSKNGYNVMVYNVWHWGDGSYTLGEDVSHSYTSPGDYNICLKITVYPNGGTVCYDSACNIISLKDEDLPTTVATSISNLIKPIDFFLFPNPTSSLINFQSNSNTSGTLQLIDVLGSVQYSTNYSPNQSLQISTASFPKGIYIARVREGDKFFTEKILLQ